MSAHSRISNPSADTEPKPLTVTISTARRLTGLGNTSIWKLISEGKLKTARVGKRRLILYASIEELIEDATV